MGHGSFDSGAYLRATTHRKLTGTDDFAYSRTSEAVGWQNAVIHSNLDPKRINGKPFGKLESRDSTEHPESNAVLLCFDVTGSNIERARIAQRKLPNLMELLTRYIKDPQVAVAANDDFHVEPKWAVQLSDFESDNRIDEHIRNIGLVSKGGGNMGESYDLVMYAAANKTVLDCFEKRNRKGYFFMYADEPIFKTTSAEHVKAVFGDDLPQSIPIEATIHKLRQTYHTFVLWPEGGYKEAKDQFIELFGKESVVTLQHPNLICEAVGAIVGMVEGRLDSEDGITNDLVAAGANATEAAGLSKILIAGGHRHITIPPSSASA